jgi:hypothetical protein
MAHTLNSPTFRETVLSNSHKIRTVSGSVEGLLPREITPLSESNEKALVKIMMNEIIDRHTIDVNTFPHLDRCSGDHVFCDKVGTGTGMRIFAFGASHVTRIVGRLAECGLDIVNLAKPG